MKCLLFLLIILLFFETHAQQMWGNVMVICTHHRNELAARGFTNIFQQDGKYCVAIRDNSTEVFDTISEWIRNGLVSLVIPTKDESVDDWKARREKEREQGLLDESVNWTTGENNSGDMDRYQGPMSGKAVVKTKKEGWDSMFNFWNVDE